MALSYNHQPPNQRNILPDEENDMTYYDQRRESFDLDINEIKDLMKERFGQLHRTTELGIKPPTQRELQKDPRQWTYSCDFCTTALTFCCRRRNSPNT